MSSGNLRSSNAFLLPYDSPSDSAISLQVERQIRIELEQAAERGMVFTRSQDNTPAAGASLPSKILHPQVSVLDKRRKVDDEGEDSPAHAVTKRRRTSAKSYDDAAPSSGARKPGRPRKSDSKQDTIADVVHVVEHNQSDQEPSTHVSRPDPPQTPANTMEKTIDYDEKDKAVEVDINKPSHTPSLGHNALEAHKQARSSSGSASTPRKAKSPRKGKDSDGFAGVNGNGASMSTQGRKPQTPSVTAAKATHKRFDSEDIEVPATLPSAIVEGREGSQEWISEGAHESEDEAPETVTASAGFEKARTSAMDAAKVAARQETEKKLRRREHDLMLRLQAKSAKKSRSTNKHSSEVPRENESLPEAIKEDSPASVEKPHYLGRISQIVDDEAPIPQTKPESAGKPSLPLLLPMEVLAAAPVAHALNPPFSDTKLAISQKRRFLDPEPKPPKDMKRGNVRIRVLTDNRSKLPPESSQASKALRESWLTGRMGSKGVIQVPRRKPSGGFVRKR